MIDNAGPDQLREIVRTLVKRVVVVPTDKRARGNIVKDMRVEFFPL